MAAASSPTDASSSSLLSRRQMLALLASATSDPVAPAATTTPRILHVMSYRLDWGWNQDQLHGFREGLGMPSAQIRVVELDAKRPNKSKMAAAVREADALMQTWKPDLVYTNDDAVQSQFAVHYINATTPFVFSGVNQDPSDYGFDKARNITGVLEREHFLGTIELLHRLVPALPRKLRIALVFDDDPTWVGVSGRIKQDLLLHKDIEAVAWLQPRTFDEFKARMLELPGRVDAVGLLGIFRFKKSEGRFADYEEVLHWVADHSQLPDFSFWDTRVERGTLCAMTVDGFQQGLLAGRMARRILVDQVSPASIPPVPTAIGRPMISLARARRLGLVIDSDLLLHAKVMNRYAWQK